MAAVKDERLKLNNITLIAVTSIKVYETIKALEYSMRGITFAEVVLVTHKKPLLMPKSITYKHCERIDDIDKFNYLCAYELGRYVDTDYCILIHYDGFIVNPKSWEDEFLKYDYIGSPWPLPDKEHFCYYDAQGNICRVGNSVSLRSKRLMDMPSKLGLEWKKAPDGTYNEDIFLCCMNKCALEEEGLIFAPLEVAARFGREHTLPESSGKDTFVFHKWWGENETMPRFEDPLYRIYRFLTDITRPLRNILGIHLRKD